MKTTTFNGFFHAVADETHPLQQRLRFVFTDYAPNSNKQGVPRDEAENLIASALYMPVKVNFDGESYHGHAGAYPVGPIIQMKEEDGVLVAEARVWRDEFPSLAQFLEDRFKTNSGDVNFSWELYYRDSETDDEGIEWLRGCVVAATTIVATPAYRGRTHLVSLAEERSDVMQIDPAEVEALRSDLAAAKDALDAAKSQLDTVTQELSELREFKQGIELAQARTQAIETRKQKLTEAGVVMSDDVLQAKIDFIVGLSDEQFADYIETVRAASQKSVAEKKNGDGIIPDPLHTSDTVEISKLAKSLRESRAARSAKE